MKTAGKLNHPVALLAALMFFFMSCYLVSSSLSGVSRLELTAQASSMDYVQLFFSSSVGQPKFSGDRATKIESLPAGAKTTVIFSWNSQPVTWLRIDTGSKPGTVRLYSLVIKQRFAADKIVSGKDMYSEFQPGHAGVTMVPGDDYVEIVSTGKDPFIVSRSPIVSRTPLGLFVIPVVLLSFFLYQRLCKLTLQQVAGFFIVRRELPAGDSVIGALDGLRGIAALMVIADHTWPQWIGLGASGVLIFFALSGFLLARPFVQAPEKILQQGFLLNYGKRRMQRILPMYYLYILLVYVLSLHLDNAVRHAFFLRGDGHLWAIPQEMLFYLVFPALALVNLILFRGKIAWILTWLSVVLILSNSFLDRGVLSLYGMNNQSLPFYLGVFVSGSWASYLYYGWYVKRGTASQGQRAEAASWPWTLFGCAVLLFFCLFSNGLFLGNTEIYSQKFYGLYGVAAAVLLFSIVADNGSSLTRLLSHPLLRSIGVVSYSLYLLHPLILEVILAVNNFFFSPGPAGGALFALTFLFSFPVALFTYRVIEYPFLARPSR